ncbi:hypothetical protein [Prescottella equi]|uniref:hypothetical protein n=1 Tax=Rhodococcus hoagii TaxID=43767 RepID=UPI000D10C7F4|nr:hypothetical protein [Prescottella equi]AVP71290.1 hypothetical protein C7H75_24725 [Prescottella equi]
MTSQLFSFEGASDDTAVVIVDGTPSEYDAYNGAQFHLLSKHGQMQVSLDLDNDSGCWMVAVGQTSEAHPVPSWPIALEQSKDCDYAVRVTITAPADAQVVMTR